MAFLFGSPIVVQIVLDGADERKTIDVTNDNGSDKVLLYLGNETVKGVAKINCKEGKKYEHQGIKVEFIGQIGTSLPTRERGMLFKEEKVTVHNYNSVKVLFVVVVVVVG